MSESYRIVAEEPGGQEAKVGRVEIYEPMAPTQWDRLRSEVIELCAQGWRDWEFHLEDLKKSFSVDIGMWVAMNASIDNHEGRLKFVIRRDSAIDRIMQLTRLDQILDVEAIA